MRKRERREKQKQKVCRRDTERKHMTVSEREIEREKKRKSEFVSFDCRKRSTYDEQAVKESIVRQALNCDWVSQ